jgi:hypothetical protein
LLKKIRYRNKQHPLNARGLWEVGSDFANG